MLELLNAPFSEAPPSPVEVLYLLAALAFGGGVAWVYRHTRKDTELSPSFTRTLVLLSVLIAMVTQVIGDNVARAFSLVGALSIVRFRTVVRDTQDTAYVIFAVVVGMAVGAHHLWVAIVGILVVGLGAFLMKPKAVVPAPTTDAFLLSLRIGIGHDLEEILRNSLDSFVQERRLMSVSTAKQGVSLDASYEVWLRAGSSLDELVKTMNRTEGVQSVHLERHGEADT